MLNEMKISDDCWSFFGCSKDHEDVEEDPHDIEVQEKWGQDGCIHGELSNISSDYHLGQNHQVDSKDQNRQGAEDINEDWEVEEDRHDSDHQSCWDCHQQDPDPDQEVTFAEEGIKSEEESDAYCS